MFELKKHEDYRDLEEGSFFAVFDLDVFESPDEWKRHFERLNREFRLSMGSDKMHFQVGSMQPFQSPIDGKMITNSKCLAEHNRRHKVTQVGNEFKNKRAEYLEKTDAKMDVDESVNITQDAQIINSMKEMQQ